MNQADRDRVTPKLEATLARELRALVAEVPVGDQFSVPPSDGFRDSLEIVLSRLLGRHYPEWENESLDGFYFASAIRTGLEAVRLVGTCILISDQTVTPFLVDLELHSENDSLESIRACLGESGQGPLGISGPPCNTRGARKLLDALDARLGSIEWSYKLVSNKH